jgi:hypothetical protein
MMKLTGLLITLLMVSTLSFSSTKLIKTNNKQLIDMKEKLLISYSTYCQGKDISTWNCFWCKKVEDKLQVTDFFTERVSDTFGYIGQNSKNSFFIFSLISQSMSFSKEQNL